MRLKYDFYLDLRQYVEETWNQADIEANTHAPRSKHQAEVYRTKMMISGNAPEARVAKLRVFWERVTAKPY